MRLWQTCARKFQYRYYYSIEAQQADSFKQQFGTSFHKALEINAFRPLADWRVREAVEGLEPDLGALVAGTAAAYGAHWDGTLKYHAVELELETDLRDKRFTYATVLDGIAETASGALAVVEHKTTDTDLRPGSYYWERTQLDLQASSYLWAARQHGHAVTHVEWDAIRRPNLKRRTEEIPPEYYVKSGKWGAAGDLKPGTGLPVETPSEFAARTRDTMLADPSHYFQRNEVVRLDDEIEAALRDIDQVCEQIATAWEKDAFPRNPAACFNYGQRCEFWDVCTGAAQLSDDTIFQIRTPRPKETAL